METQRTLKTFKVLIVEDTQELWEAYQKEFADFEPKYQEKYELFFAPSVDEGVEQLHRHPDVDVITVDYELSPPGNWGTDFVDRVRDTFKGPMLAASSVPECNQKLVDRGCEYRAKNKGMVPHSVHQILRKQALEA